MDTLNIIYLVGALLIFASIMASTLSARLGVPLLLLFLIVGMLAGEAWYFGYRVLPIWACQFRWAGSS